MPNPRLIAATFMLTFACANLQAGERSSADGITTSRETVDLCGSWEFSIDPNDVGRAEKWFDKDVPFTRTVAVPGAWNAQGVAFSSAKLLRDYEDQRLEEQKTLVSLGTLGRQRESEKLFSVYPGPAWYRKVVTIPSAWHGKIPWLVFEGVHREAEVWVNGHLAASHHSYLSPFRIDLSKFARAGENIAVVVRVDARRHRDIDPLMGCLDTLDFLYITWGGIHRPVKLEATEKSRIENVFVVPQLATDGADIRVAIEGPNPGSLEAAVDVVDAEGNVVASVEQPLVRNTAEAVLNARMAKWKHWSPQTPYLYSARIRLLAAGKQIDARSIRFGMREFEVAGNKILLNGKPIFLRGCGDVGTFPNTICPPVDKSEFRRRLTVLRDFGFNYVRNHSWVPPEEYLDAADELGIMIQPEFPLAYRWDLPITPEAKRAVLEEWEQMVRLHRNHPSIVVWCMGNEQYNSFDQAGEMYRTAKRLDPTRPVLDSDGCHFSHQSRETLDFLVAQEFDEGASIGFQHAKYNVPAEVTKPVVAHEMGYFVTLPDLNQRGNIQGGLRPYWLDDTRSLTIKNGCAEEYPEWLLASYRLQAVCLKTNIEAARNSRLSGTSVWLFHDYPNCAEGVVDMFWHPKSLSAAEFRKFSAPTVLLLGTNRSNYYGGEAANVEVLASSYEDDPFDRAVLTWKLSTDHDLLGSGVKEGVSVSPNGLQSLVALPLVMPQLKQAQKLMLEVSLIDGSRAIENAWNFWVFPRATSEVAQQRFAHRIVTDELPTVHKLYPSAAIKDSSAIPADTELLVTSRFQADTLDYLAKGGRVLLLDPGNTFVTEKTDFRLSSWNGGGPSGTIIDRTHPALRAMPNDGWCDLQFYHLIQKSKTIFLDSLPAKVRPLIRCIDRPQRLANRAYLFEATVGRGKLLVSGFNFPGALHAADPAAQFLLVQLVDYAVSGEFQPQDALSADYFREAATK